MYKASLWNDAQADVFAIAKPLDKNFSVHGLARKRAECFKNPTILCVRCNVGGDKYNLEKHIPDLINNGDFEGAADAIRSGPNTYGESDKISPKLEERRYNEAYLFLYGIYRVP